MAKDTSTTDHSDPATVCTVLIDRVRNAVKALVERAEAEWAVWEEKNRDVPLAEVRFAPDAATWAAEKAAVDAFEAVQEERDTMVAIEVQLKGLNYDDAQAVNPPWPRGPQNLPRAYASRFRGQFGFTPQFLDSMRELEQALLKARKWLKAKKRSKRKRKDDDYVWLNATGAARYIGTTSKSITTWIREGTLRSHEENGTKYKFLKSELDAQKAAFKPRKSRKTGD